MLYCVQEHQIHSIFNVGETPPNAFGVFTPAIDTELQQFAGLKAADIIGRVQWA